MAEWPPWCQNLGDAFPLSLRKSSSPASVRLKRRTRSLSSSALPPPIDREDEMMNAGSPFDDAANNNWKRREMKMNTVILASVFLLGVLTALFVTLLTPIERGRKQFQPLLPQIETITVPYESGSIREPFLEIDNECEGDNALGYELEAVSAVHAALEMKENGKGERAQKLFKHAMALCPRHPDILTHYGEFFEEKADILMADLLYVQALSSAPFHGKALTNRKRTLPLVEEIDDKHLRRIEEKKDVLLSLPEGNSALRRVKKEAYFQHLYHTAGLEGNTLSLAETRAVLETRLAIGGKSLHEHNEILGLDAAMKFINGTLVPRIGPIGAQDILDIHKHVMGLVDTEGAGNFRKNQVWVGTHVPPRPENVKEQFESLVDWINSEEASELHPIHLAALAHYRLVYVHPFADGNGRTSRLLMNWILMVAGYPPVIIRKQERATYYEALNTANRGDVRPFIRFIAECTEKTVDVYLWATREMGHYHIQQQQSPEEADDSAPL